MAKLSDYKALLFDIDRTLTSTKGEISSETIDAIHQLHKMGYIIGVCSGRGVASIKNKILPIFPQNSLHIATGGSQLINSKGKVIWQQPINPQTTKKIKDRINSSDLHAVFMKEDAQYAKEPTLTKLKNHPWNFIAKNLVEMSDDGVGAIYTTNLNDEIVDYVKNDPNLSYKQMVGNSGNPYIDITAQGVNKATTLKKWSLHTGINSEEIIGFGDSLNDLEFIKACGYSVAMGNAVEELKQVADKTIGHTDDNSLAEYLTKIINGENL